MLKFWMKSFLVIFLIVITYWLSEGYIAKSKYLGGLKTLHKKEQEYYYGLEGERVNWPKEHSVRGIDVSRYQPQVNWPKVRIGNISFAFMKATEGFYRLDPLFGEHWEKSREVGLVRGAYHFFRPDQPAWLQAINFMRIVKLEAGDLPPVLDVEQVGGQSAKELRGGIKTWLNLVEQRYSAKPILYTNYHFYQRYLAGHFDGYPLWIAHYQVPRLRLNSRPGSKVSFWQHTDRGKVAGIKGRVDCNVFFGSLADLKKLSLKADTGLL
jgi:lysozyme